MLNNPPFEDPLAWFEHAFAAAQETEPFDAARAALGTVRDGKPRVRFVLLKSVDAEGFTFFTNYESAKAEELELVPHAALAFHWHTTGIQVRVEGPVERVSDRESDAYFDSRPRDRQLAAWASPQSSELESRAALDARVEAMAARFEGQPVSRPSFWGGYRIAPDRLEFWVNEARRLHDRFEFVRRQGSTYTHRRVAP